MISVADSASHQASVALQRLAPALAVLRADAIRQVNLDVPAAIDTLRLCLARVKPLRARLAKELPTFDSSSLGKLADCAEALAEAHARLMAATSNTDNGNELRAEALELRERLAAAGRALSLYKLLPNKVLTSLRPDRGYQSLAHDLLGLSKAMRAAWPTIHDKCPAPLSDLERARALGTELRSLSAGRNQLSPKLAAAHEHRARVFTLTVHLYDELRRAVGYLRAEAGDANDVAPPLYPGRAGRKKRER